MRSTCTAAADHPADPDTNPTTTGHFATCSVVTTAAHPDGATTAITVHPDATAVPVPAALAVITQRHSTTATSSVASQGTGQVPQALFRATRLFQKLFVSAVVHKKYIKKSPSLQ